MKKSWLIALLVCLLALLPAAALAESPDTAETDPALQPEQVEETLPADAGDGLQLKMLFQYMPSIKPLQGTGLVVMESKMDNSLGVFTSEGQEVIPYGLSAVNVLTNGFLSVAKDKDAVNGLAIYRTDGSQVTDFAYGAVTVFDQRWVAGTVLTEASGGEKDMTVNKVDYKIAQWDLYFVSEDGVSLVASLDRQQFASAKQHGDYISITDRNGVTTAYDRDFQPLPMELKDMKASYYRVENYQIISNITNEVIASGYTDVQEADLPTRMLLVAGVIKLNGFKAQAVLDLSGNELMPTEYAVVTMGDPYVVVANESGLRGLYSLAEQRLVAPCEFTNILTSATSVDPYVNNGYICVEKDGKRGYVDARTCAVTCPPAYNSRIAKVYGCSTVFDGESGYVLIAADGTRTELFEYDEIPANRGNGYLLVAKKNGFYGIIDWHGNEMLPFIHKNIITLTDDSKALIRTSTGLELDAITAY